MLGQFGALGSIGTCLALCYGPSRPWVAGLGLAVAMFKPTYGVPVAVLMLAQGDRRSLAIGLVAAVVPSMAVAGVLAWSAGGIGPFLQALAHGYTTWRVESGEPLHTVYRVDAAALVAQLLGQAPGIAAEVALSVGLVCLGAMVMRRLAPARVHDASARGLAASIGSVVVLTAVYHLQYDLLLLVLPITWLMMQVARAFRTGEGTAYAFILILLLLPMANYVASERGAGVLGPTSGWWHAATALNACAPLLALFPLMLLARESAGTGT